MRRAWQGSRGEHRNWQPSGWKTTRLRILHRDRSICHLCGTPGADQVDHVNGDHTDNRDANLAAVHDNPCHRRKSAMEGVAARPTRRRPNTPHPGLLG